MTELHTVSSLSPTSSSSHDDDAFNPLAITPDVAHFLTGLLYGVYTGRVEIQIQDGQFFGFRKTIRTEVAGHGRVTVTPARAERLTALLAGIRFGSVAILIKDGHFEDYEKTVSMKCPQALKQNKATRTQRARAYQTQRHQGEAA